MKFLFSLYGHDRPACSEFPHVQLVKNGWNDFNIFTLFHAYVHLSPNASFPLGLLKVMKSGSQSTILPDEFETLGSEFCSLGQDFSYYSTLKKLNPAFTEAYLDALNDVVRFPDRAEILMSELAFNRSLLRTSEAEKLFKEGPSIFFANEEVPRLQDYSFSFKFQVDDATHPHMIDINFSKDPRLPCRINVLVGDNGTGKTEALARIANALSGEAEHTGNFSAERPVFSKTIVLSYSLIDNFRRPAEIDLRSNYVYCGIINSSGRVEVDSSGEKFTKSYLLLCQGFRQSIWRKVIRALFPSGIATRVIEFVDRNLGKATINPYDGLSTGQAILLSKVTDILAHIEIESLILIDEPETHLHPSAISGFMNSLNSLLEEFDSYSIIATHSPAIVQEIPSSRVQIMARYGSVPNNERPEIECFGENLTAICNEVFDIDSGASNYRNYLRKLASTQSYEAVLAIFNGRLSMNATIFLSSLYGETAL